MPKVELTMNQWGLVLDAVRTDILSCREVDNPDVVAQAQADMQELITAEDRIIDMAFDEAKRKRGE